MLGWAERETHETIRQETLCPYLGFDASAAATHETDDDDDYKEEVE